MVLTTVFICNTFSAGMPLMPFVASATFFLLYRVDKWNVINYHLYNKESKMDSQMATVVAQLLPMSAVLHCFFTVVLWSDKYLSPYSITEGIWEHTRGWWWGRAFLWNTFPQAVLMCVFFVICTGINSKLVFDAIAPACIKVDKQAELELEEDDPTWTEYVAAGARDDEVLSYDVSECPFYKGLMVGGDLVDGVRWRERSEHISPMYSRTSCLLALALSPPPSLRSRPST